MTRSFSAFLPFICISFFSADWVCAALRISLIGLRVFHGHTCDVASSTTNPIVKAAVDVKEAQATKKTRGSGMVAEGMMSIHTAH